METFQVAIIGGGPAGYTAAEIAGKAGLRVVLFEKNKLGGVCLNEGCIPTKTLLYSAKMYNSMQSAAKYGVAVSGSVIDLKKVMSRKSKVIRKLMLGIKAKLVAQNVSIITGEAYIKNRHTICCEGIDYTCDALIVCTGSETFVPSVSGLEAVGYWTHYEALENTTIPQSLVVVGGGVIGMEFVSFFSSIGVQVTVIEMMGEILGGIDYELAALLRADYAKRGVKFMLSTKVTKFEKQDKLVRIYYENEHDSGYVKTEKVLMSTGRRPVMKGFGLENLNLELTSRGLIQTDKHMQTSQQGVYVCGDLNGVSLLAHTAVREAEIAVHHLLGGEGEMNYQAVPGVVYTNPEVASVGATEEFLEAQGLSYRSVKIPMTFSGRFVAENEGINGLCKVLVDSTNTILGVHILGNPASELIVLAGMMIQDHRKLPEWGRYIFPHPTVGEIFKELFLL